MSDDLQQKLGKIKAACRQAIELSAAVKSCGWKSRKSVIGTGFKHVVWKQPGGTYQDGYGTAELQPAESDFIAYARTFSPAAAQALLAAIEGFLQMLTWDNAIVKCEATGHLQHIADQWPDL